MAWAFNIDERLFIAKESASVTTKDLSIADFPTAWQSGPVAVRIHGLEFRLVTDNTVANRRVRIRLSGGGGLGVVMTWPARATVGALSNSLFHFDVTGNLGITAVSGHQFETWPDHVILPAGWTVTIDVEAGFAAGDRFSDIVIRGALLEGIDKSTP